MSVRKIGNLQVKGRPKMVVYYDDQAKVDPYRIYFEWYEDCYEQGMKKRKRLVEKWDDMKIVGERIKDYTYGYL